MSVKCDVKFEHNPHGVFYSGQVMSGTVQISIDKPKKFKGIYLKFGGYAKCNWTVTEYRNQNQAGHQFGNHQRSGFGFTDAHNVHNNVHNVHNVHHNVHHHNNQNVRIQHRVNYSGREDYLGTIRYIVGPAIGIRVIIDGSSKSHWTETRNNLSQPISAAGQRTRNTQFRPKTVHYQANEIYLNTRSYLERGMDGNEVELLPGVHTYTFQCSLPAVLPTSFEGKYGSIRYTVKVVMERPWKFDISHKVGFTVLKLLDLNYDSPILRMPCQMEITKSYCCWFCRTGPISLTASVPQTGYVPGQDIVIQAQVINLTKSHIEQLKFELRQSILYHSQTPSRATKEELRSITQKRSTGVAPNNEERYEISLPIPSLPPTNVGACRIIYISYDIKIETKLSGVLKNPFVEIPITIGNVPLQAVRHAYENVGFSSSEVQTLPRTVETPSAPSIVATPDAGAVALPIALPHSSYADLPPPSYEECVSEAKDPDEDGDMPFTPRYPVYRFASLPQESREESNKN